MSEQEYILMDSEGNQIGEGDLITWWVYDSDDFVTWQFVGVYEKSKDEVLYLGGGIDFGTALGKRIPVRKVMEQAENNEDYQRGIKVIGSRSCVAKRLLATDDYAALQAECNALWSTYIALGDKLGIDTDKARKADGKPSDVFVSYVDALRDECEQLRAELTSVKSQEPVAFMVDGIGSLTLDFKLPRWMETDETLTITPLYTLPTVNK